jgi:hypothetical protein
MISWMKNPYSANTVTGLAMMSQSVLIFTHAVFVGRPITSQKGVRRARKFNGKHIHFEWLGNWHWSLEAKLLEQSYRRVHTQFQPCLRGTISTVDGYKCFGFDDLRERSGPT